MNWLRRTFAPNRLLLYLTTIGGAASAAAVYLQDNPSTDDTLGILISYGGALVAALLWLKGWQAHEARTETPDPVVEYINDLGDAGPPATGDVIAGEKAPLEP